MKSPGLVLAPLANADLVAAENIEWDLDQGGWKDDLMLGGVLDLNIFIKILAKNLFEKFSEKFFENFSRKIHFQELFQIT